MAQRTVYFPDDLELRLRERAAAEGRSVSAIIGEILSAALGRSETWPADFVATYGSWEGDLAVPPDPPPEDIEPL